MLDTKSSNNQEIENNFCSSKRVEENNIAYLLRIYYNTND